MKKEIEQKIELLNLQKQDVEKSEPFEKKQYIIETIQAQINALYRELTKMKKEK